MVAREKLHHFRIIFQKLARIMTDDESQTFTFRFDLKNPLLVWIEWLLWVRYVVKQNL